MRVVFVSAIVAVASVSPALAQLSSRVVVTGLSAPVAVVQDPTQPSVQFIVEQVGRIRVVQNGVLLPTSFLDLSTAVLSGGEQGLLGLVFAPDYATSHRFFVDFTRQPDGATVIARFRRSATNALLADPASRFDLTWPVAIPNVSSATVPAVGTQPFIIQPFANHNAGDLEFGSDGFLYIPLGDGGSGNDPFNGAQNPQQLLGKTLRIDVNVPDTNTQGYVVPGTNPFVGDARVLPQIWSFGLRNPFRVTFDSIAHGGTGALVIADVGQNAFEEVDYEPALAGGRNYGWSIREGLHPNVVTATPFSTPLTDPILEYDHGVGNVITGGVVYRGTDLGIGTWGRYFYADFGFQRIWSVDLVVDPVTGEARAVQTIEHTAELGAASISAFGIGANCEVYYLDYLAGELRRMVRNIGGGPAGCPTSPDPFLTSGGGVFVNGGWVRRSDPVAAGAGMAAGIGTACATPAPAPNWVCLNGGWFPPDNPLVIALLGTGGTTGTGASGTPPPPSPGGCTTVQPVSTWVCVNGGWLPPDSPLLETGGTSGTGAGGTPPPPPPSPGGCTTVQPASTWVCLNGGWLPPDNPAVSAGATGGAGGTTGGTTGTATAGGCTTPDPFVSIPGLIGVCVGGGWTPHPIGGGV